MVLVDLEDGMAFLKPYKPNKNSGTIVLTIPIQFADICDITPKTQLIMEIDKEKQTLLIKKVKEGLVR
jgi:hypothetical protein